MAYTPLNISKYEAGLVQSRQEFILPNDAYPTLINAYVWRERILRKQAFELLGRLQRNFSNSSAENLTTANGTVTFNIFTNLTITESNPSIAPGTGTNPIIIILGAPISNTLTDSTGTGVFVVTGAGNVTAATINYSTGVVSVTSTVIATGTITLTVGYYPTLPVMGIRIRENQNSTNDQTVFFDQVYAYIWNSSLGIFQEFIPGTTWNAKGASVTATDFFWSTNYWTLNNKKLFWVTNNTGSYGALLDPIRYTDGTTWYNFGVGSSPLVGIIDASGNYLNQCLALLPFRGRLVAFNTYEGSSFASSIQYSNRIRWCAVGNPLIVENLLATPPVYSPWRDDVRGKGGFLDIPTSEDIISIGFVRDNLVIYCERSTWQLRYTGRSIAPFQIEKVNSELGTQGTFSSIQFDTSLVGIGDKGIVECDSYKSERIDIKIPDFVFNLQVANNAPQRIQGIRDFEKRLAYWTCVSDEDAGVFPDTRLVYNYENNSWATFSDTLTALGTFQLPNSRNWLNTNAPWLDCKFTWIAQAQGSPSIVGGNQQGFIEYLDQFNTNDPSLNIDAITTTGSNPTVFTSANHNLKTGQIVKISNIPTGTPFATYFNNNVYMVIQGNASKANPTNQFTLNSYNPIDQQFSIPNSDPESGYIGGGLISVRDNFNITSKKFNYMDQGQNIQIGYIDILMNAETNPDGAISMNMYLDYQDGVTSNTLPKNAYINASNVVQPDLFFNSTIPTSQSSLNTIGGSKFMQRVFCNTRASFLTLEFTFSNAQMAGVQQTLDVQIDSQTIWQRPAGRNTSI